MPLELNRIHPHWLYDRDLGCYLQRAELGEVAYPNSIANEPLWKANQRPRTRDHRGSTYTERIEMQERRLRERQRQRQRQADRDQQLVMAPADDEQYTVYMTEAGPVGCGQWQCHPILYSSCSS
ncbi:LOW QUALITY PROTEIN: hypothetical protein ACJ73_00975 [Blastomyces percursus]|uniref:Uncharacterized protein n=1 Tax=Blastomyces percursus TaxID=1658174 RepID=A0A1J9QHS1_9EURO|nr:LOW QUALITY PROTEIN: hypothetical protein ACJ73_00975 [Blastomyces percursus]